jgi:hypothetical protein
MTKKLYTICAQSYVDIGISIYAESEDEAEKLCKEKAYVKLAMVDMKEGKDYIEDECNLEELEIQSIEEE